RVIVDDIMTHPYWTPYKELAAKAGLAACWSEPIRSSFGQVLGTFAIYQREVHSPAAFEISLIEKAVHLVSIAIERKRAEEALRASEQEFRTLAENLPELLIRYDRDGRRTYVSPAMERAFSVPTEQLIGKTLREVNPTGMAMPETYQRALEHTLATGERSEFEVQIPLPDGNMRTGLCFIVAERAADGRISGAIAVSRDISERKRMENEIRRRERKFRSLAENSPDPIFRYDHDCRRLYANPASSIMSGHPVESLVGATPGDGHLLGADDAARLEAGIRRVFDSGEPGSVDVASVDRDGRPREYQVLLVPEPGDQGKVETVLGLAHDTTAIRDAERRMTDFVANLPGFAFTFRLSPEGHCSFPFASPGVENLAGLKPADVKNDWAPALALVHPDDVPHIITKMTESVRTMTPHELEIRVCRPGLPVRWIEIHSIPLRQADGSILWHGIMLDVDERKRNEAELERHRHHLEKLVEDRTQALSIAKETAEAATRAKSQFLAAASHDLRQPLQAIRLFNDALSMTGLGEVQNKISSNLSKSVNSLGELLNQLLDLSRLDAGMIEPQPVVIQAGDLLGVIGAEFDAVSREKSLSLNLFCPQQGLKLFSDYNLLLTLLRNLVSNAVKYTARGGVLVSIRQRGDRALIQVWDTGIGISPEQTDSIFEEYFQIGNPERARVKGVGLGLSIVKRLSKLLDIGVRVRSREGKGSVFELNVPLANEPEMHATPPATSASPECDLMGKRIVVIEDDAIVAKAIEFSLEMEGAQVILFGTAEDALGSAETMGADYYISDYRLPGMDGLRLLDAIQRHSTGQIKGVVLTGNTSPEQIALMQSSRWKVLIKPVDLSMLLTAMAL
ncbi:MAG: PAS domain-containing protein, partial [Gammaproteobacteria bacterium]|nr:PAS domain-containing protein [Gammaproteobacteria bacterium]